MIKVCIISCGMITNSAHIPAYRNFGDDFFISAVSDINEKAAEETAKRHGIPNWYKDAEEMLEREKPDLVSVCVPNCFHKEYVLKALSCGANVLCEKPLAVNYADAKDMFDKAESCGRLLMACQSMRFTPDRLAAKEYIEKNGLGRIYCGDILRVRRRGIPYWGTFHMKKISLGGAFVDIGVHMLDALLWLMGNPMIESVSGAAMQNHKDELGTLKSSGALTGNVDNIRKFNPDEMDVEDFACGNLKFRGGANISFKVAWAANMPESSDIRLVGDRAGMDLPIGKIYFGESGEERLEMKKLKYDAPFAGHMYIADNLRKVLKGVEKPFIKPEETMNAARIIEMFYKSAELGKEVFADKN